jgi:hypothetical protein
MAWLLNRTLTCLFWLAVLCGVAAGISKSPRADWLGALLFALQYIVAAWAAVGGVHRLARGAMLVVAPLAFAGAMLWIDGDAEGARDMLWFSMIMTTITFVLTFALATAINFLLGRKGAARGERWQISLTEILGWTIVCAIASWAASISRTPDWENVYGLWTALLTPIPAATIAAAFLGSRPRRDRFALVAVLAVMAAFVGFAVTWDQQDANDLMMYAIIFGAVGLWTLVVRLDENAADRAAISKWWPRRKSPPPVETSAKPAAPA